MAAEVPDEVPVGDTSVVCFNYTLEGNLCEVPAPPRPQPPPLPVDGTEKPFPEMGGWA